MYKIRNLKRKITIMLIVIMAGNMMIPHSILSWPGTLVTWAETPGFSNDGDILIASISNTQEDNEASDDHGEDLENDLAIATPADATVKEELFVSMEPEEAEIPSWYTEVFTKDGERLYTFINRNNVKEYRIYGIFKSEKDVEDEQNLQVPSWYSCDVDAIPLNETPIDLEEEDITLAPYRYVSADVTEKEFRQLSVSLYGDEATLLEMDHEVLDESLGRNYDNTFFDIWWFSEDLSDWSVPVKYYLYGYQENGDKTARWYECDARGLVKGSSLSEMFAMNKSLDFTTGAGTGLQVSVEDDELVIKSTGTTTYDCTASDNYNPTTFIVIYTNGAEPLFDNYITSSHWNGKHNKDSTKDYDFYYISLLNADWHNPSVSFTVGKLDKYGEWTGDYSDILAEKIEITKNINTTPTKTDYDFELRLKNPNKSITGVAVGQRFSYDMGEGSTGFRAKKLVESNLNIGSYAEAAHRHTQVTVTNPTCTEAGTVTGTCKFKTCGGKDSIHETIPALGHDYGSWTRTEEPGCTVPGVDTRTCTRDASHKETRSVDPLGHNAPASYVTTENNGTYYKDCTRCRTRLETKYNPYTVRFHANADDVTGAMPDQAMTYNTAKTLAANQFARQAYLFEGWAANADGTGTIYKDRQSVNNLTPVYNGNVDLYAKWKLNECTITYDGNGGASPVSTEKVICKTDIGQQRLPQAARFGYTFLGWSTQKDRPDLLVTPQSQFDTVAVTLYAQWKANSYDANFDPAGGTLMQTHKDVYYELPLGELPVPQKQGVTFTGWVEQTKTRSAGVPVTENTVLKTEGIDLIATYAAEAYTIHFDANGGTTDAQPIQRAYGQPYGTLPTADRTGYVLKGWFTEREGGIQVTESSLSPAYNQTLYAHWYPISYSITFDANGGTGTMLNQDMNYDMSRELRVNRFINQYHRFTGWALKAVPEDGDKIYKDTEPVRNLADQDGANVVLYAQWARTSAPCSFYDWDNSLIGTEIYELGDSVDYPAPSRDGYRFVRWEGLDGVSTTDIQEPGSYIAVYEVNSYTATFMNGGETAGTIEKNYGEALGTLPKAAKEGHTFIGWYTSPDEGTKITEDTPMAAGGATYYAHFSVNTYAVTFHYNGGTEGIAGMDREYGQRLGTLPTTQKTGYVFSGWNTAPDGTGAFMTAASAMGAEDIDLYAVWDIQKVLCIFLDDEGNPLEEQYVGYDGTASPKIPIKTGYTFTGWDKSLEHITQKTTFIAGFRPVEYRIEFSVNKDMYPGATGDMQAKNAVYDVIEKLPAGHYTYEHFTFTGWTMAADGTGPLIGDKAGVINLSSTAGATVTLYAQFARAESPCKFVDWDGTLLKEEVIPYGADGHAPEDPARAGYQFVGWSPATEGISEPTTFTAQYTANHYYVAFDSNTADGSMEKQEFTYDVQEALDGNTFHKDYYIFSRWNTKADGTGDSYADGQNVMNLTAVPDSTITMYAQWDLICDDGGNGTNTRPGPDKTLGTEDDEIWTNGPDGKPGTDDDQKIENTEDGTGSYVDNGDGTNTRPGADGRFDTEDDEIWTNGPDGKPGTADDYRKTSSGGSSGGGGGGSSTGAATAGVVSATTKLPSYVVTGIWFQNENGRWMFKDSTRTYADEWAAIYNPYANVEAGQSVFDWFRFDKDGFMVTGWYIDKDGNSYFLHSISDGTLGRMYTGWNWIDGKCYYFNEKSDGTRGALKRNFIIKDGYKTDHNGAWIVDSTIQPYGK